MSNSMLKLFRQSLFAVWLLILTHVKSDQLGPAHSLKFPRLHARENRFPTVCLGNRKLLISIKNLLRHVETYKFLVATLDLCWLVVGILLIGNGTALAK